MLTQITENVLVHQSDWFQSNAAVVRGQHGVLLVDPGIRDQELAALADELTRRGDTVAVGFSTHPHWDHLLWHPQLGAAPRYGTAQCATVIEGLLSDPDWKTRVAPMLPPDIAGEIPLDNLFGRISGLPAETAQVPWDGPGVHIIEHQAHAPGHAALLVKSERVLIAGDMLSDILIPILNLRSAGNQVQDYLNALSRFGDITTEVDIIIPGHGSVAVGHDEIRRRIDQDRAYMTALQESRNPVDTRVGPDATFGQDFLPDLHTRQVGAILGRTA